MAKYASPDSSGSSKEDKSVVPKSEWCQRLSQSFLSDVLPIHGLKNAQGRLVKSFLATHTYNIIFSSYVVDLCATHLKDIVGIEAGYMYSVYIPEDIQKFIADFSSVGASTGSCWISHPSESPSQDDNISVLSFIDIKKGSNLEARVYSLQNIESERLGIIHCVDTVEAKMVENEQEIERLSSTIMYSATKQDTLTQLPFPVKFLPDRHKFEDKDVEYASSDSSDSAREDKTVEPYWGLSPDFLNNLLPIHGLKNAKNMLVKKFCETRMYNFYLSSNYVLDLCATNLKEIISLEAGYMYPVYIPENIQEFIADFESVGSSTGSCWIPHFSESPSQDTNIRVLPFIDIKKDSNLEARVYSIQNLETEHIGIIHCIDTVEAREVAIQQEIKRLSNTILYSGNPMRRYIAMMDLQKKYVGIFYIMLMEYVEKLLPVVYTPTVEKACMEYWNTFRNSQGLYISLRDKGKIIDVLRSWPHTNVQVIVVTVGEQVLGLEDLGCQGMGVAAGKSYMYTALGGIHPSSCLPITIDVGTNNENLLKDASYIGLRQSRTSGQEYSELLDEFMSAVKQNWGDHVLIEFEDFSDQNAVALLAKYQASQLAYIDNIQGTASVLLAGIITTNKLVGGTLAEKTILFFGVEAGTVIAPELISLLMSKQSKSLVEETRKKIWLVDSEGLIVSSRKESLQPCIKPWAHEHETVKNLLDVVKSIKPAMLIGSSRVEQICTQEVIEAMSSYCEKPVIFAFSNSTSQSGLTANQVYTWSKGSAIFASRTPFDPVKYEGKVFVPSHINTACLFPGFGLGLITSGANFVHYDLLIAASEALAAQVSENDLDQGKIFPQLTNVRQVSECIAADVATKAYDLGLASRLPRPNNMAQHIASSMYHPCRDGTEPD